MLNILEEVMEGTLVVVVEVMEGTLVVVVDVEVMEGTLVVVVDVDVEVMEVDIAPMVVVKGITMVMVAIGVVTPKVKL